MNRRTMRGRKGFVRKIVQAETDSFPKSFDPGLSWPGLGGSISKGIDPRDRDIVRREIWLCQGILLP